MPVAHVQPVPFWNDLAPLTWDHHCDNTDARLCNDGDTILLQDHQQVPTLSGGPLIGTYRLHRVNFHWGSNNQLGGHHRIGDTPCAMEIHATYYNCCHDLPSVGSNATQSSSWAIVGLRFALGASNSAFQNIADNVQHIRQPGSFVTINADYLTWLKQPITDRSYMTYKSEIEDVGQITWIVFDEPDTLAEQQVDIFRTVLQSNGAAMMENRCKLPISPLGGEIVFIRDTPFLPCLKNTE